METINIKERILMIIMMFFMGYTPIAFEELKSLIRELKFKIRWRRG